MNWKLLLKRLLLSIGDEAQGILRDMPEALTLIVVAGTVITMWPLTDNPLKILAVLVVVLVMLRIHAWVADAGLDSALKRIEHHIRDRDGITATELTQLTGIERQDVGIVLECLLEDKIVEKREGNPPIYVMALQRERT
jgi:hypothetical protein